MPDTKSKSQNFLDKFLGRYGKGSLRQRVSNNERKITLLKNIIRAPKAISPEFKGLGKSPIEPLEDIHESLDELIAVIRQDAKLDDQKAEYERLKKEREARDAKEKKLEKTNWDGVKKIGAKILKPFQSIWDKIWGFVSKILLGNILMRILGWMGDKKNQEKLKNIFRFMKDWWPALLSAYLLFGNAFGRMIVGITAKVALWTATIVKTLIPKLLLALTQLKASKFMRFLGGGKGKALLMTGGLMMATPGLIDRFTDGGEEESIQPSTEPPSVSPNQVQEFAQGGFVSGPSGVDKVPAKLTAGEFVMSKGAVQKYGAGTLAGMNAAGGGTNLPTMNYNQGGLVAKYYSPGSRISLPSFSYSSSPRRPDQHFHGGGLVNNLVQNFEGGGLVGDLSKFTTKATSDLNIGEANAETLALAAQELKLNIPGPPSKGVAVVQNSSVQSYIQQQQEKRSKTETQGNKIPEFDAEAWMSKEKIKVLGISL